MPLLSIANANDKTISENDTVWQWFGNCSASQILRVRVLIDGKAAYKAMTPICSQRRADIAPQEKSLVFSFKGRPRRFGDFPTGKTTITGNIWRAGGEHTALLLGVSFSTGKQVLLNTIHIADPSKVSRSELAHGIIISTSPQR